MNSDDVKQLVKRQLEIIDNTSVHSAIEGLLVDPFGQIRESCDRICICWVVAEHPKSNTRFVYCQKGIVPSLPWGIVSLSGSEMGMDSNWFTTFEGAFYDSFASAPLTIWNVINRNASTSDRIVESSLTLDEASDLITRLNKMQGNHPHSWRAYCAEPRTKMWW